VATLVKATHLVKFVRKFKEHVFG